MESIPKRASDQIPEISASEQQSRVGSQSTASDAHQSEHQPSQPKKSRHRRILLILFAIMAALSLYVETPKEEIALWHLAVALEKQTDGNLQGAIDSADKALQWNSQDSSIYLNRANFKEELGWYEEALKDCNRAIELAPEKEHYYQYRAQIYQGLNQHDQAIQDWKYVLRLISSLDLQQEQSWGFLPRQSTSAKSQQKKHLLNGYAYARALGDEDLENALADVEKAIQLTKQTSPNRGWDPSILDTRGFVLYKLGDYQQAQKDLTLAVALIERSYLRQLVDYNTQKHQVIDLRELRASNDNLKKTVAVLRYHRSLVLDELSLTAEAENDRKRIRELGYEPSDRLY